MEALKETYLAAGYPDYEADLMSNPSVTPATKQAIAKQHADLTSRGIRQPLVPPEQNQPQPQPSPEQQTTQENQPPQQAPVPLKIEEAAAAVANTIPQADTTPAAPPKEWPDIPPPRETTPAEREKWRTSNQKENNKLLQATKTKSNAHTNALLRYNHLTNLNDSGKLPEGIGRFVINPETGEPYGAASLLGIVNKETQDFVKTVNDFLVDAKTYFGGRVTNFDIQAFKSRLPTLMNTEEGRRLIIEQMKIMEELQVVHDKELERGLKHYGRNASYTDIQNVVDEKTTGREEALIGKMNNVLEASGKLDTMSKNPAKYKDTKLMRDPETGKFWAVPLKKMDKAKAKGYVSW